jgi:hypothetical protein
MNFKRNKYAKKLLSARVSNFGAQTFNIIQTIKNITENWNTIA